MRFLLRRIGFYLIAAWVSITINFFIPRADGGRSGADHVCPLSRPPGPALHGSHCMQLSAFVQGSLWTQYITYLGHLFQGDLGLSISNFPVPVTTVYRNQPGLDAAPAEPGAAHLLRRLARSRHHRRLEARPLRG
jgi:peptide/nickel transport system permease protein